MLRREYQAHARLCCLWAEVRTQQRFRSYSLEFLLRLKANNFIKHSVMAKEQQPDLEQRKRNLAICLSELERGAI